MADHSKPVTTDTYSGVLQALRDIADEQAQLFDPATTLPANLPTGSIRWNSAADKFQKWSGAAWAALTSAIKMAFAADAPCSITASSTSAALTITQTGTGNALVVEDATSDTTPFVIDGGGNVIIGTDRPRQTYGSSVVPAVQLNSTVAIYQGISRWSANSAGCGLSFAKSRGAAVGTKAAVASGDSIANIFFDGDDGTNFLPAAAITASVEGTPGTGDMPGRLVFSTTPDGGSAPVERVRIDNAGNVGIGSTSPTGSKLRVEGTGDGSASYHIVRAGGVFSQATNIYGACFISSADVEDAAWTLPTLDHFVANQSAFGAATVTNQVGFKAQSSLTGATNNYGFYSNIAAAAGRWNFYANGTASNYFAGQTGIGGQVIDTERLRVVGSSGALSTPLTASEIFTTTAATFEATGGTIVSIASTATETGTLGFSRAGAVLAGSIQYDHALDQLKLNAGGDLAITCHNTGGVSISKTAVASPAASDGNVFSGTYTPSLTNTTNVASSTAYVCQYMRVGNVVTVSGMVAITPTTNATQTVLGISLPVASNFSVSTTGCAGTGAAISGTSATNAARITQNTATDVAEMAFVSQGTGAFTFAFHFTYQVL